MFTGTTTAITRLAPMVALVTMMMIRSSLLVNGLYLEYIVEDALDPELAATLSAELINAACEELGGCEGGGEFYTAEALEVAPPVRMLSSDAEKALLDPEEDLEDDDIAEIIKWNDNGDGDDEGEGDDYDDAVDFANDPSATSEGMGFLSEKPAWLFGEEEEERALAGYCPPQCAITNVGCCTSSKFSRYYCYRQCKNLRRLLRAVRNSRRVQEGRGHHDGRGGRHHGLSKHDREQKNRNVKDRFKHKAHGYCNENAHKCAGRTREVITTMEVRVFLYDNVE